MNKISALHAALVAAFPAAAVGVLSPPDAETPLTDLYPPHVFTDIVCDRLQEAIAVASGGKPFAKWYCAEADLEDGDELYAELESLPVDYEFSTYYAEGSIEYVKFYWAPGYLQLELGGSNVMSGVDVYGWNV